jgi:hypothetical protein
VTKSTVQRWVKQSDGKRLERVEFQDQRRRAEQPYNKSSNGVERCVLRLRKQLKEKSILGLYGAPMIHRHMQERGCSQLPSIRTIGNILKRHGQIDKRTRIRRAAPPPGWYLTDLVQGQAELDSFDIVEKLYLQGGQEVQFFNGISLHGSLVHSAATETVTSENTVLMLIEHWKKFGLPKYVQFDNDMVFQ